MSKQTKVEWTGTPLPAGHPLWKTYPSGVFPGATFNPWIGCEPTSPGCKNCYAWALAKRAPQLVYGKPLGPLHGLPVWGAAAPRRVTSRAYWQEPLAWNKEACASGVRKKVFCASLADVFEDFDGPLHGEERDWLVPGKTNMNDVRRALWALIDDTPYLDWLILTKRADRIAKVAPSLWLPFIATGRGGAWPRNVWIGTTCESQQYARWRLPDLLALPAPVRFVSYEPALEEVDFGVWLSGYYKCPCCGAARDSTSDDGNAYCSQCENDEPLPRHRVDWLSVGGESGDGARPFDLRWARRVVADCRAAEVPVFVKQMGARPYDSTLAWKMLGAHEPSTEQHALGLASVTKKGGDISKWPKELRVRKWPPVDLPKDHPARTRERGGACG